MLISFQRPIHTELRMAINASALDVARLMASCNGYHDVDLQPQEPGRVTITAHSSKAKKLHFSGPTMTEACNKLIEALCGS